VPTLTLLTLTLLTLLLSLRWTSSPPILAAQ